jgi:hypothetical protein
MDFTQTVTTRNAESCLFWGPLEFSYRHPPMDSGINRAGGCRSVAKLPQLIGVEASLQTWIAEKKFTAPPVHRSAGVRLWTATMALATDWGDSGRTAHRLFLLDKRALRLQNSRANLLFQLKS